MAESAQPAVFSGVALVQLIVARKLKNGGAQGSGAAMATRALSIATLYVGAGACGFIGLLGAFGFTKIEDYRNVGRDIRRAVHERKSKVVDINAGSQSCSVSEKSSEEAERSLLNTR